MPLTFKSSITITSWLLMRLNEVLCRKSLRQLAIFSYTLATFRRCFWELRLSDSLRCAALAAFLRRAKALCSRASFFSYLARNLGLTTSVLSDKTIKSVMPKSMPILLLVLGKGCAIVSTSTLTKYLPDGDLDTVALLIRPFISRSILALMRPILGSLIEPRVTATVPFWLLVVYLSLMPFLLNLGKPKLLLKKL